MNDIQLLEQMNNEKNPNNFRHITDYKYTLLEDLNLIDQKFTIFNLNIRSLPSNLDKQRHQLENF